MVKFIIRLHCKYKDKKREYILKNKVLLSRVKKTEI